MNRRSRILAGFLSVALAFSGTVLPQYSTETEGAVSLSQSYSEAGEPLGELPKTDRTIKEYDPSFLSLTGFASEETGTDAEGEPVYAVNDRTSAIGTDAYRTVYDEDAFLQALTDARSGEVSVIEIAADLDLGWNALSEEAQEQDCIEKYGWSTSFTVYNPSILQSGVSQLTIANTHGLTIFSKSGVTVRNAEWKLQGSSSDIVIRNIKFDVLWSFRDDNYGDTKNVGWTLIKLNGVKGVWIDHCTLMKGYDGCIDSENGSENMTVSWCDMSPETDYNMDTSSTIYKTYTYLYELYKAGQLIDGGGFDTLYQAAGGDLKLMMAYECYHHKFNLNGSGDKDFMDETDDEGNVTVENGNQRLHLTMAYDKINNIMSRFPVMRQGTAHYVNCYLDNSGYKTAAAALGRSSGGTAISARNGATVGVDTCVFKEVGTIVSGSVVQAVDSNSWGTAFSKAHNNVMIVNSRAIKGSTSYDGNSYDSNGSNAFVSASYWTSDYSSEYMKKNFSWFSSIVGDASYKRGSLPTDESGNVVPFTVEYSEDPLPYSYQAVALDDVEETVETYAGAYTFSEDANFWLRTRYDADDSYAPVPEDAVVDAEKITLSQGSTLTTQVGAYIQIDADIYPSHATSKEIDWTSSNPAAAEVRDSGLLIGKSAGATTIMATVTNADGTKVTASCEVTVTVPVESVEILAIDQDGNKTDVPSKLYLGDAESGIAAESAQLVAVITPEDATDPSVTWKSSNTSVLKISKEGVLTPVKKGTNVTVTCTSVSNPEVSNSVKITVKEGANPDATSVPTQTPGASESSIPATPTPEESETPATIAPTETPAQYYYGDVDLNGALTATDALLILQHVVNLKPFTDEKVLALADVSHDTEITAVDALKVLQVVVKLAEPELMIEGTTEEPTKEPTAGPTAEPTEEPTAEPTEEPTEEPTQEPVYFDDIDYYVPQAYVEGSEFLTQGLTLGFYGADGFGKYATGGRGGKVYEVTTLEDDGEGSLRAAVEASGPRIIVFKVSGTIYLEDPLTIRNGDVTIAGQTAPGDGICLANYGLGVSGAENVIIRYIRIRPGDQEGKELDAIDVAASKNVIIDHCSTSWATDETLSVRPQGSGTTYKDVSDNVSVQYCMITESITVSRNLGKRHGMGSLIRGAWGASVTYHHNFYATHSSRMPMTGTYMAADENEGNFNMEFVNNVVYNWSSKSSGKSSDADADGVKIYTTNINYINNVFKKGNLSSDTSYAFEEASIGNHMYLSGNMMDGVIPEDQTTLVSFEDDVLATSKNPYYVNSGLVIDPETYFLDAPFSFSEMSGTQTAQEAETSVLATVGASLGRDSVDTALIDSYVNGTKSSLINSPAESLGWTGGTVASNLSGSKYYNAIYGNYPKLNSYAGYVDSDHDGMGDDWEKFMGLDPQDASDAAASYEGTEYTNLDVFLQFLIEQPTAAIDVSQYQ